VERLDRLRQRVPAAAGRVHRPQPEQHAQLGIDLEVRDGGGGELPRRRDLRLVLRSVALLEREDRQTGRDERSERQDSDERAQAADRPTLQDGLTRLARLLCQTLRLSGCDARGEVLALEPRLGDARFDSPRFEPRQLAAAHEQARVAVDVTPLPGRGREPLVRAQVVSCGRDPVLQPRPPAEERLVRDLDRRRLGPGVAVEGEQPRGPERVDRERELALIDVERVELCPLDPPTGIRGLAEHDQAQKELVHSLSAVGVQSLVEDLRSACDRPGDSADRLVRRPRERRAVAALMELGQRVLQQRQRTWLVDDVGHDLREQTLLERHPHSLRRARGRPLELVRRQRKHRLDRVAHHLAEPAVEQRPVVEVRPQRRDHSEPAPRVTNRQLEARQEVHAPLVVLDEREDLLELVDDEQQVRAVIGEDALDGPEQAELVRLQLLPQRARRIHRDPQKRRLQLLERIRARRHHGDLPAARADLRDESGEHHGRFPAPARPDDGEKPLVGDSRDELADQLLAAEEVLGVRLEEGVEALVRVADLAFRPSLG
jgi:hypothetical protein